MYASGPPTMPGSTVSSRDRNFFRGVVKTAFPVLDSLTTLLLPAIVKTTFPSLGAMLVCYSLGWSIRVPYTVFEVNALLVLLLWPFGLLEPDRFVARLKVAEKVAEAQLLLFVVTFLWQGRLWVWGITDESSPYAAFGGPLLERIRRAGAKMFSIEDNN